MPDTREPEESEDERLVALIEKLRPDRLQLSWRQRRRLPRTSKALAALVEQVVSVELDQAVREALAERAPEIAVRWVEQGTREAEQAANLGGAGSVPAVPVSQTSGSAPVGPQAAAGGFPDEPPGEPNVPDGIDPSAGWTPPVRGIRSRRPRRLLG